MPINNAVEKLWETDLRGLLFSGATQVGELISVLVLAAIAYQVIVSAAIRLSTRPDSPHESK